VCVCPRACVCARVLIIGLLCVGLRVLCFVYAASCVINDEYQ